MKRIKYPGRRLKKTAYVRRGLSALLCVCMMLSMVSFTATVTPARAVDPPAEMETSGYDLEEIANYEKALHFLIRHWHMDEDKTAQYQGGTTLQSGGRYITVTEGYIIPAAGGYSFYAVNQGTGKLSEMDPATFPASSNYVESMNPATGEIVLTPYFVLLGGVPVEQFAGWSISTGHDAVTYREANGGTDERLVITYKANVHLVKGHAFYISDGEIVEGSVQKAVFGGEKVAFDLERDVDWAWVFTEDVDGHRMDDVAVDKNNVPYTELNLPDELQSYVDKKQLQWMQIHNTNQGLHTDKTAYDHYEVDPESGEPVSDGRTYDVDLKAWYTAGYAPVVGMVLDASGSMGFAADIPEPIRVTEGTDVYEKLADKIGAIEQEEKLIGKDPLLGFYEFRNGSYNNYRLWYFNSAKEDYTKYEGKAALESAPMDDFAHAVKQSTLGNIDFRNSAPVKIFTDFGAAGWDTTGWTGWGAPPANLSTSYGFNLTNKPTGDLQTGNSGFLLDVVPKDTTDFTIAFTLYQQIAQACTDKIEILYIGPKVADSGDNYFHVYRTGGNIIAEIGGQTLTLEGYFNNTVVNHNFSFVFSGDTLKAYVDGNQAGTLLDDVPAISSADDDTCVVFAPFEDENQQVQYFFVDSIYLIDAALDSGEAKVLSNKAGTREACGYLPGEAFLTANELTLLMDTRKTDNSKMGFNGYSYFVYDASESTAEYNPLSYYTNDDEVPNDTKRNVSGPGWYYVSSSGTWANVSNTTKTLRGIVGGESYVDHIEKVNTVTGNTRGAAPDVDEATVSAGNSGATYKPSFDGPIMFYIDKEGYLRCFYGTSGTSADPYVRNTSYVYELRDDQYVKEASLQRALGDFVTQLNEVFPQSDVAATRFSTQNAIHDGIDESYKLILLDWTHDVTKSAGAMGQRWGSDGSSVGTNNYPENSGLDGPIQQYDYVLTGSTSTYTGLHAFQKYLAPIMNDDKHPERFLIIFTDGKDTEYDSNKGVPSQTVANELKRDGYTIFTVLLSAGTVAEGTQGYTDARNFLLSLSGTQKTTTDKEREPYFFSIYTAIKQIKDDRAAQEFGGTDDYLHLDEVTYSDLSPEDQKTIDKWYDSLNMNTADVLTQIFSKKILSMITQPLSDYVVQDYIDPRFDLVAGVATKDIDNSGLEANITYNSTGKSGYTFHLRVNGEIAIGNEDASVIYATVNLKKGTVTDSAGNVFYAEGSVLSTDAEGNAVYAPKGGVFMNRAGETMTDGFVIDEFLDENGKPLDPSLIITWTGTTEDEDDPGGDPGEDPEQGEDPGAGRDPGKYYLNIHLISASRAAIRFACLFYDDINQMYYLQWMDQTIPASTYAQTSLSVWRARITLRAKEDFLGGNAVLTNGQLAHMNYVFHTGDELASSGTERSYWKEEKTEDGGGGDTVGVDTSDGDGGGDTGGGSTGGVPEGEYLSKGFPRVTVNVKLPDITMRNSEWTLWVGETVDPSELMQALATSISDPLVWDGYMSRYGHSIVPYPPELRELSLTQLVQLSSLYRLHVAMDEAKEDSDEKSAAEAAYNAYRAGMDAALQNLYDTVYKEYADTVKDPVSKGYERAIYNDLRKDLLKEVGIGRGLTYYSTNQLMAGLLDDANTVHGLYLPYAYLNSFNEDGGSEGNQAGLIEEQQRDVLGVIRYRWERVNYYTGETIENGGYFRDPGEVKLENGVPNLNQEFTIYDTRTLQYRLTITFWPFPDPDDTVWDNLIYSYDAEGNRTPRNKQQRIDYLDDHVKTPLASLRGALVELQNDLTGYKSLEELMEAAKPFQNGEFREKLHDGVTDMGFDEEIWGEQYGTLDKNINEMNAMLEDLDDDTQNTNYYNERLAVRDKIDECLAALSWFDYAVEYLEWCIGVQDTGGKFSHLDRTNDRNQFNYDDSGADDGLDPDGYEGEEGTADIITLIKDKDYKWTKQAVGTTQYYKMVEGSRTTHIVRGELAFEMKLDFNELEYLFTTEWKDKAETGVTYHVDLTADNVTAEWDKIYGDAENRMSSPKIPEELTITIKKSDLETLRERALIHAARPGDEPVGTLYYQAGFYSTGESSGDNSEGEGNAGGESNGGVEGGGEGEGGGGDIDTRLPNPNLSWYPKAVYDMRTGEVTFYTDPRIYDPVYLDENGKEMYVYEIEITDEEGNPVTETVSNNDYARLLPKGTYTLKPNAEKNKEDWAMFVFDDFGYAPLEDYERSVEGDTTLLRKSHFTDNTADTKANAVNSVYAPRIDTISGATPDMEAFMPDSNKYAPLNTGRSELDKLPEDDESEPGEGVTFYLGTFDYNAVGVTKLQRLTARVGMGMVTASLKYEMPATGGPGTGAYLAAGGVTFLMGLGLFLHREWRRRLQTACIGQICVNRREN